MNKKICAFLVMGTLLSTNVDASDPGTLVYKQDGSSHDGRQNSPLQQSINRIIGNIEEAFAPGSTERDNTRKYLENLNAEYMGNLGKQACKQEIIDNLTAHGVIAKKAKEYAQQIWNSLAQGSLLTIDQQGEAVVRHLVRDLCVAIFACFKHCTDNTQ